MIDDLTGGRKLSDVSGYVESRQRDNDRLDMYFIVGEDDRFIYFANVYGFDWETEEQEFGEPRFVQVETAVLDKGRGELFNVIDNDGIGSLGKLDGLRYWDRLELEDFGIRFVSDSGNVLVSWLDFV